MSATELKDRIKTMTVESQILKMEHADAVLFFAPDGLAGDSIAACVEQSLAA